MRATNKNKFKLTTVQLQVKVRSYTIIRTASALGPSLRGCLMPCAAELADNLSFEIPLPSMQISPSYLQLLRLSKDVQIRSTWSDQGDTATSNLFALNAALPARNSPRGLVYASYLEHQIAASTNWSCPEVGGAPATLYWFPWTSCLTFCLPQLVGYSSILHFSSASADMPPRAKDVS